MAKVKISLKLEKAGKKLDEIKKAKYAQMESRKAEK